MEGDYAVCYMVAGMSSRFGGRVKQLVRVGPNEETLIEISILQALKAGFNRIVFIVGEKTKVPFYEKFGDSYHGAKIDYVEQLFDSEERDKPWGTNDAVCAMRGVVDCPFVVCNGDDIYGEGAFLKIIEEFKKGGNVNVTLGYILKGTLPENGGVSRAVFELTEDMYVKGLKEMHEVGMHNLSELGLTGKEYISMNIFGFQPEVLGMLYEKLVKFKFQNQGERKAECYLPSEVSNLISEGRLKLKVVRCDEKWFGVTNPEDEAVVREELKAQMS